MKKCALQILSICLALLITYFSGGLNIYHYCCDACKEHGHDIFQTISCEEVHASHHCDSDDCHHNHHNHTRIIENTDDLCAHLMAKSAHCDVHHISAPYFSQLNLEKINLVSPLVAIIHYINIQPIENEAQIVSSSTQNETPQKASKNSGRAIIVRKSSYLI